MRSIESLKNISGKKVLVRADFNVPVENGIVLDAFKIKKALPTINFLIENKAKLILSEDSLVRVNVAYFPAWKMFIDNNESSYIIKDDGLYVNLLGGEHLITARFVQTPIEKISNMLSLVGLLGIIIVIIPYGKKTS